MSNQRRYRGTIQINNVIRTHDVNALTEDDAKAQLKKVMQNKIIKSATHALLHVSLIGPATNCPHTAKEPSYEEWLNTLRVDDQVIVKDGNRTEILTIRKITPTKQIKTDRDYTFKQGKCKLSPYHYIELKPITYEEIKNKEKKDKRTYLASMGKDIFSTLSQQSINTIYDIIKQELNTKGD